MSFLSTELNTTTQVMVVIICGTGMTTIPQSHWRLFQAVTYAVLWARV